MALVHSHTVDPHMLRSGCGQAAIKPAYSTFMLMDSKQWSHCAANARCHHESKGIASIATLCKTMIQCRADFSFSELMSYFLNSLCSPCYFPSLSRWLSPFLLRNVNCVVDKWWVTMWEDKSAKSPSLSSSPRRSLCVTLVFAHVHLHRSPARTRGRASFSKQPTTPLPTSRLPFLSHACYVERVHSHTQTQIHRRARNAVCMFRSL